MFQQIRQRALQNARRHFGVIEGQIEQRPFVNDLVAALDEAEPRQLRQRKLSTRALPPSRLAVIFLQHGFGYAARRFVRQRSESDGIEHFALVILPCSLAGQLAFALGQDDQRPQNHQQRHGILGQSDVAGLPSVILLKYGALGFAQQGDADVSGEGLCQQAHSARGEALFHFIAKTAVYQQTAYLGILARQVAHGQQTCDQACGRVVIHADFSFKNISSPALIAATSLRCTGVNSSRPEFQRTASGNAASGASSGSTFCSPINVSRDRR